MNDRDDEPTGFVPPVVRELADEIEDEVGVRPQIVSTGHKAWEVRLEGEHLLATARFHHRPMDGRVVRRPGVLVIDGEERPLARNMSHLRVLWRRYELGEITPIPPQVPVWEDMDEVPLLARRIYERVIASLAAVPDDTRRPVLTRDEQGNWLAGFDAPEQNSCLRIMCVREGGMGAWLPHPTRSIIIQDGMYEPRRTGATLLETLEEMLEVEHRRPASSSTGPISGGSSEVGGKANSVTVRRSSVIRV